MDSSLKRPPPIQYTSCFAVSFLENTRKCSNIYLLRYSFFKREKNKMKRDNFISIMVGHPAMAILFKIYIQNSDVVLSNKALKKDMVGKKYKNLFKRFE